LQYKQIIYTTEVCPSHFSALANDNRKFGTELIADCQAGDELDDFEGVLVDDLSEDYAFAVQFRAGAADNSKQVAVVVLESQIDEGEQAWFVML
jgi:hypothetical protein